MEDEMTAAKERPTSRPASDNYRENYDRIFIRDKCTDPVSEVTDSADVSDDSTAKTPVKNVSIV